MRISKSTLKEIEHASQERPVSRRTWQFSLLSLFIFLTASCLAAPFIRPLYEWVRRWISKPRDPCPMCGMG